jgi:hypothetical protein
MTASLVVLLAVFSGGAGAAQKATGGGNPFSPRNGHAAGLVPPPPGSALKGARQTSVCPCGGGNLTYHNGPVMRTNNTYAIYWQPSGYDFGSNGAGYKSLINRFFTDVAHDSGLRSNVYAPNTQYYDTVGGGTHYIQNTSNFVASTVVTTAFPDGGVGGCEDFLDTVCLTDSEIQAEIQSVVIAHGWPQNGSNLYFLFTPQDVGSCFDDASACAYYDYCAYHGSYVSPGGEILYANQPYTADWCDTDHPNGSDADPTINVISHEHNESITDPNHDPSHLGAWYDNQGFENGDKCAWTWGPLSGSTGSQYNQTINGHHYILQEEFNNAASNCVQTLPAVAPTVSTFSPTSGGVGTSVTINGTGFGNVTAVRFHGTSASFTVNSGIKITATVPAGATTGTISVTTASAGTGTSAGTFTVTGSSVPTISGFTPTSAKTRTLVTINGTNLSTASSVKMGPTLANSLPMAISTKSATQIKAWIWDYNTYFPTGKIYVVTPSGTATSAGSFTITFGISSLTPTSGSTGALLTIKGVGFNSSSTVKINGTSAAVLAGRTATQLQVHVPSTATTGKVTVTNTTGVVGTVTSWGTFTKT